MGNKKLIIGSKPYSVVIRQPDDNSLIGLQMGSRLQLVIDPTPPREVQESTLAHEILHAIITDSGAYQEMADQEKVVVIMENVFYRFLKDNGFDFEPYLKEEK